MSLVEHAKKELERLSNNCNDQEGFEMQEVINKDIISIVEVFANQNHSGFTASYVIEMLEQLLKYRPLTPLTGNDDEWIDISESNGNCAMWQNNRAPMIFKDDTGKAYNIEGKVFSDDNGESWFTNGDSRVEITFPYNLPLQPEYILVEREEAEEEIIEDFFSKEYQATQPTTESIPNPNYIGLAAEVTELVSNSKEGKDNE